MPSGVLTLEPGTKFWFEGDVWELDELQGEKARLRRGSSVRAVSINSLLEGAAALEWEGGVQQREEPLSAAWRWLAHRPSEV